VSAAQTLAMKVAPIRTVKFGVWDIHGFARSRNQHTFLDLCWSGPDDQRLYRSSEGVGESGIVWAMFLLLADEVLHAPYHDEEAVED